MKWAILLALVLSGCSEYYERQNQERIAGYQNQCAAYGFSADSLAFSHCVMDLDQQNTANRQALIGAYLANQPRQQPYVLPMPAPVAQSAPRNCVSTASGQTIYTNCN